MRKKYNVSKFKNRDLLNERLQIQERNIISRKIKDVNSKINALKRSDYYDVSESIESLKTYTADINLLNEKGVIYKSSIKKIKGINLVAVNKAIEDFRKNKQSSVEFLDSLYYERRKELSKFTNNEEWASSLTKRQLKSLYKMFSTEAYEKVNSQLSSDEIFTPYVTALSEQWTEQKFIDTILINSGNINDLELRNDLKQLYNSTIKGKIQYARQKNK